MKKIGCSFCGQLMPVERLEVGLTKCKNCTDQTVPLALMNYSHKTCGEVIIINGAENQRQAINAYNRKR